MKTHICFVSNWCRSGRCTHLCPRESLPTPQIPKRDRVTGRLGVQLVLNRRWSVRGAGLRSAHKRVGPLRAIPGHGQVISASNGCLTDRTTITIWYKHLDKNQTHNCINNHLEFLVVSCQAPLGPHGLSPAPPWLYCCCWNNWAYTINWALRFRCLRFCCNVEMEP